MSGQSVAQDLHNLFGRLDNSQRSGIDFLERMLMLWTMQNDQRLAQSGRISCIKCCIPLLVFLAKAHHDNIGLCQRLTCADRVQLRALVVMPVFLVLGSHDRDTAIIRGRMIRDRPGKAHGQIRRALLDLVAPVRVNLACQIDAQLHAMLLFGVLAQHIRTQAPKANGLHVAGQGDLWQVSSTGMQIEEFCVMVDFASRRQMMVDTQVRPSDVTKFTIIDAMLRVPREVFVPDNKVEAAYVGENLSLGGGRVLLDPRTLAKMLDALAITRSDLVLDIGCGTGYSAALMQSMAQAVVGLEEDESLASAAEAALAQAGAETVVLVKGSLTAGAPDHAPYDVMILQGGIETFPDALVGQLAEGGRVCALFMQGALGVVRLGVRKGDVIGWRDIFNAAAPVLPGFEKAQAFSL